MIWYLFFRARWQGKFFSNGETLFQFRRILSLGDITYLVPFPLGMSVFGKAGYADLSRGACAFHCRGCLLSKSLGLFFDGFELGCEQGDRSGDGEHILAAIHKSIALLQRRLGD